MNDNWIPKREDGNVYIPTKGHEATFDDLAQLFCLDADEHAAENADHCDLRLLQNGKPVRHDPEEYDFSFDPGLEYVLYDGQHDNEANMVKVIFDSSGKVARGEIVWWNGDDNAMAGMLMALQDWNCDTPPTPAKQTSESKADELVRRLID